MKSVHGCVCVCACVCVNVCVNVCVCVCEFCVTDWHVWLWRPLYSEEPSPLPPWPEDTARRPRLGVYLWHRHHLHSFFNTLLYRHKLHRPLLLYTLHRQLLPQDAVVVVGGIVEGGAVVGEAVVGGVLVGGVLVGGVLVGGVLVGGAVVGGAVVGGAVVGGAVVRGVVVGGAVASLQVAQQWSAFAARDKDEHLPGVHP